MQIYLLNSDNNNFEKIRDKFASIILSVFINKVGINSFIIKN